MQKVSYNRPSIYEYGSTRLMPGDNVISDAELAEMMANPVVAAEIAEGVIAVERGFAEVALPVEVEKAEVALPVEGEKAEGVIAPEGVEKPDKKPGKKADA